MGLVNGRVSLKQCYAAQEKAMISLRTDIARKLGLSFQAVIMLLLYLFKGNGVTCLHGISSVTWVNDACQEVGLLTVSVLSEHQSRCGEDESEHMTC